MSEHLQLLLWMMYHHVVCTANMGKFFGFAMQKINILLLHQ